MTYRDYSNTNRTKIEDKKFIADLKTINNNFLLRSQYVKSYMNVFDILGYDLNSQYIYAVTTRDKFSWLHTEGENKDYTYSIWNVKNKCNEYLKKSYDLDEHILSHIYPLELKRKPKHRINYVKYDMCGCDLKIDSDILVIDIDCHKGNSLRSYNVAYTLINHFKDYLYLERSVEGGYHLFIKLDKEYSITEKRQYINELKERYNINDIEMPTAIRFPFSYHYEAVNTLNDSDNIIPCTAKDNIKNNYNSQTGFILYTEQIKIIKNNVVSITSKIFDRSIKSKIKHYTPEEFLTITDIFISKGNRHNPMLELVRIGKFNNWSIEDIKSVIKQLDLGSKDLSIWSDDKLYSIIEEIYDSCKMEYREFSSICTNKFISNMNIIPKSILEAIQNEQFIENIITNCDYKLTDLNRDKFKIILSEMIGYIYYDCINNRKALNNKTKYIIGKQFSKQYADLMSQFYSDKFNSIDCHSIIKTILKRSKLFTQYKINTRGWYFNHIDSSNNFCKQYDLINNYNHSIFNNSNLLSYLLFTLYNSYSIKQLNIQDFFIINNSIIEEYQKENTEYYQDTG